IQHRMWESGVSPVPLSHRTLQDASEFGRKAISLSGKQRSALMYYGLIANLPEYRNLSECEKLIKEVADELKIKSPLHSD
ncbi:MAG: hypothetical protein ACLQSR_10700, partial [Limisphaerales bacterium]